MRITDEFTGLQCETCDCLIDPLDADESGTLRCHLCGVAFSVETAVAHGLAN